MVARSDSWACPGGVHKSVDAGGMWGKVGVPCLAEGGSPGGVLVGVDASGTWKGGSPGAVLCPRVHATSTLVWTPVGCGRVGVLEDPRGSLILEDGGEVGPSPCDVRVHVDAGRMWGFGSPYWSLVLGPRVLATSTLVWTPLGCGQTLSPCHLCHHPPSSSVLPRIHAASTPSWMPRGSQGVCHSATPPTSNWRPCRSGRLLEFRDPMSMCACVRACARGSVGRGRLRIKKSDEMLVRVMLWRTTDCAHGIRICSNVVSECIHRSRD